MERVDMPWGYIEIDTNEIRVVSTVEDPPKVRLGSVAGGSLGGVSFDRIRPDGRSVELVLVQGKQDERTRGQSLPAAYAGEITVHINRGGEDDADMRLVATLRYDRVQFHVPVRTVSGIEA